MTLAPVDGDVAVQDDDAARNHMRAVRFIEINRRLDALGEEEKALKEERATLEEEMYQEIERTAVTMFRVIHEGQRYTLYVERKTRAHALDHAAVVRWFNANGLSSKVQVPAASLSALVKEYVDRGDPIPEGLDGVVSTFTQHAIRQRRVK